jgi:hypothetical protein
VLADTLGEEHFLRNKVEHGKKCYHGTTSSRVAS